MCRPIIYVIVIYNMFILKSFYYVLYKKIIYSGLLLFIALVSCKTCKSEPHHLFSNYRTISVNFHLILVFFDNFVIVYYGFDL